MTPEMICLPEGTYKIGSTEEEVQQCVADWSDKLLSEKYTSETFHSWIKKEYPKHSVALQRVSIAKFPVTNNEYREFVAETKVRLPESLEQNEVEDHPVWGVSFEEAKAYADWLRQKTGEPYRLPTETEWEAAARGQEDLEYPYGDSFDPQKANSIESGFSGTTPVTAFEQYASPLGACDLAGNVEEWVDTLYRAYPGGPKVQDDLVEALGESYPVLRGGSFARGGDLTRCARRHGPYPSPEFRYTGFRLAKDELQNPGSLKESQNERK